MQLNQSIRYLKGIGPKKTILFERLGIRNVRDLLYHFPLRYEDRKNFSLIKNLVEGNFYTIKGNIRVFGRRTGGRFSFNIFTVCLEDGSGRLNCVWFNQPYLKNYFKVGQAVIVYGRIERYKDSLEITNPEFEVVEPNSQDSLNIGRIVPIYPLTEGLSQRFLRKIVKVSLDQFVAQLKDPLAYSLRKKYDLVNLAGALINLHFLDNLENLELAKKRFSFEEFILFQIVLFWRKLRKKSKIGTKHKIDNQFINSFIDSLPFKLTSSQEKSLEEIKNDLIRPNPMYRLLEGDVGSGKTIVALIGAMIAVNSGSQSAVMVPTEILAQQHYDKMSSQLSEVSYQNKKIRIRLLTGSLKKKEKEQCVKEIEEGRVDIVIGTHALLEENIKFKNLGLVIIDEQHKFGVIQRSLLAKKGINPDVLIMTATPIPRTLALTVYGDLDISSITELPKERKPIKTEYYPQEKKEVVYNFIKEEIKKGRQGYIVYPVIEESLDSDLLAAKEMFEFLSAEVFSGLKLGLIHGKLRKDLQNSIMNRFKNGELDILVATTVLEVGIDVANATFMLIEECQRFGLSQLHQLRGRIGRGREQSSCILTGRLNTPEAKERVEALLKSNDGFYIAQKDLEIRGQGELFGSSQHGLIQFKLSDSLKQIELLKLARAEAISILKFDPRLILRENQELKKSIIERYSLCALSQVD
jgi:ATP-dependent DNA helicase RecG